MYKCLTETCSDRGEHNIVGINILGDSHFSYITNNGMIIKFGRYGGSLSINGPLSCQ